MRKLLTIPAAASLALAGLAVAQGAPAGAAAGDLSTVSITVSMDLPSTGLSDGPIVYQVTDVPVVAGPELTGADLVSNPSNWGGSVTVDVDNATHHITIATEDSADFETATVTVTGAGLGAITLVSDNLWTPISEITKSNAASATPAATLAGMPLTYGSTGGTATIDWTADPPGVYFDLAPSGAAIFAWTAATPATTTPATTATPTTQAVQPLTVVPAFTG